MNKILYAMMLIVSMDLILSCSTEKVEWEDIFPENEFPGGMGGGGGFGNNQGGSTLSTEIATFDIDLNMASFSEQESVPNDDEDYVENSSFTSTVKVAYDGNTATCNGNIDGVSVSINGANVVVNSSVKGVSYELTGSTANGSFKIYSDKKFELKLNGVSITNASGAAINIQSKKRVFVHLVEGTTNTFYDQDAANYTDAVSDEDMKACFFSEGQLLFSGKGALRVYGRCKAGIRSDDYIMIRPNTNIYVSTTRGNAIKGNDAIIIHGGVVNCEVSATAKKGISSDGYITIGGGRITVITSGGATYDSDDKEASACAGIKADSTFTMTGGEVYLKSTGAGGKGISADDDILITGGTIEIITSGNKYTYSGNATASPKGIKSDGNLTIEGGSFRVRTTGGEGAEGIECKKVMNINGGNIQVYAYDDAINSSYTSANRSVSSYGMMYVNGGNLFVYSIKNDALDANRDLYINGGNILAVGSGAPENALDAAEGYNIFINGGNLFAIGGSTALTSSSSKQASIAFSSSVSGQKLGLFDSNGKGLMYVEVPSTNCSAVHISTSGMAANSSYTVKYGVSVSGGNTWCGMNTTGSITGGTTLGTTTASKSVGSSMGMGRR